MRLEANFKVLEKTYVSEQGKRYEIGGFRELYLRVPAESYGWQVKMHGGNVSYAVRTTDTDKRRGRATSPVDTQSIRVLASKQSYVAPSVQESPGPECLVVRGYPDRDERKADSGSIWKCGRRLVRKFGVGDLKVYRSHGANAP